MITKCSDQQRFTSLVEASPMPMAIYEGKEMVISVANQAMLDLWGKDDSVIGKPFIKALPEIEGQPFFDVLVNVLKQEKFIMQKNQVPILF